MAGQNEIIGIGVDQAQALMGASVGAGLRLYLRPAGKVITNAAAVCLSIAAGGIFWREVQSLIGVNAGAAGAIAALLALAVSGGVLRAVERFDFASLLKRKEP